MKFFEFISVVFKDKDFSYVSKPTKIDPGVVQAYANDTSESI